MVGVRLPKRLIDDLDREAKTTGKSRSEVIRGILERGLPRTVYVTTTKP